jgi:hypothetical protein
MVFSEDFLLRTEFHLNLSKRVQLEIYLRPVTKHDSHGVDFHETHVPRQRLQRTSVQISEKMGTQICYGF